MFTKIYNSLWLPVISALLLALARMDFGLGFLVFVGFVPLLFWLELEKTKASLWKGAALFSLCFNGIYLYWISSVSFWGYIGIILFFILYFWIVFYLIQQSLQKFPCLKMLAFASFWISLELYMGYTELAFPWLSLGYSLAGHLYLIQLVSLGGMSVLSLGIIAVNYSIFRYIKTKNRKFLLAIFSLLLGWSILGFYLYQTVKVVPIDKKVAILQPNIPLSVKHSAGGNAKMMKKYNLQLDELVSKKVDLALLPESSIMAFPLHNKALAADLVKMSKKINGDIFLGFLDYQVTPKRVKYTNSCSKIDTTGKFFTIYSKNILVPLGERVPFLDIFPFLWNLKLGQANWEYGQAVEFYKLDDYLYSPVICYEIAFARHLRKLAQADFIVNITNDAWFGRTVGAVQHMQMAIFRAIELRRTIYRCANTGYSVVVLPTGEILQKTGLFEEKIVVDKLYLSGTNSFYSQNNFEWIFVVLALLFCVGIFFKSAFWRKFCGRKKGEF